MTENRVDNWVQIQKSLAPRISLESAALVIIDMQKYQTRKEWTQYQFFNSAVSGLLDYFIDQVATVVEPNTQRLIQLFRENSSKVIYSKLSSVAENGSDLPDKWRLINVMAQRRFGDVVCPSVNHPGSEIISSLKPEPNDSIVVKQRSGIFTDTNFEIQLRDKGIKQLIVTGVVTNMCVLVSALVGTDLGFDVFIVDDASAAWNSDVHKNALHSYEMAYGNVLSTSQLIGKIEKDNNLNLLES